MQRENLLQYHDSEKGEEPQGLEVTVVDSGENLEVDAELLGAWTALNYEWQLNGQVRAALNDAMVCK